MTRYVLVLLLCLVGTVSTSPFCMGALKAQQRGEDPVMPPPGNPGHPEPPKGAYCDTSDRPAHHCECHMECVFDENGQMHFDTSGEAQCRGFCWRNYCKCARHCQ